MHRVRTTLGSLVPGLRAALAGRWTRKGATPAQPAKALAVGYGACIATHLITVDKRRVGYMYREPPDHAYDSGWRFLTGTEAHAYLHDTRNQGVYDINTIANLDPDIVTFLDAACGSAFERNERGQFVAVAFERYDE